MKISWKNIIVIALFLSILITLTYKLANYMDNRFLAEVIADNSRPEIASNSLINTRSNISHIYTRSDATLMVNDQPFFPLGFYHDWYSANKIKRLTDLENIAAAGFNVIHADITDDYDDELIVLDEAERLQLYVLPHYVHPKINNQKFLDIVNKYKHKPALLGWYLADDVDAPSNAYTPQKIQKLHNKIKALDTNHITYISGFSDRIIDFIGSVDVVGFQSYPISNNPNDKKPLRRNYYNMLNATKNEDGTPHNRSIIANLQTFSWENSRPPTFKEIYNMTYGAIVTGVKGIIYYSFFIGENSWDLSQNTDLWNGMKSLVPEIKQLSPVFLEGKLTQLDTKVDDLYVGEWVYGNLVYVVVLNTSPKESINASIMIPTKARGLAQPVFPGRPSGMVFEDGKLSGLIQAGDVHIYQLSKE
ncbi:hypothetical protein ACEYW6_17630 [Nostoc sp. UIC 10607]|uniref:hypothetical protein n=1 Tax=Nostoc sp. UIC 10607 TaxID=3045935 RepID=UPI0039A1ED61